MYMCMLQIHISVYESITTHRLNKDINKYSGCIIFVKHQFFEDFIVKHINESNSLGRKEIDFSRYFLPAYCCLFPNCNICLIPSIDCWLFPIIF